MEVKPFNYPGDPPADVAVMDKAECLRHYPRPTMYDEEEAYRRGADFVAMPDTNEVVCDSCGGDVAGPVYVLRYARPGHCTGADRAYCQGCAEKSLSPYCG